MVKRADYGKTLSELMADANDESTYAPSDESYESVTDLIWHD